MTASVQTEQPNESPTPSPEHRQRGWREHVFRIIDNDEEVSPQSQAFEIFITVLILLSILSIVLESFSYLQNHYSYFFDLFENLTIGIFIVEYLARVLTVDYKYKTGFLKGLGKFFTSGSGIIDFIAISPLLFKLSHLDFRFLRALKITRILRVLKLSSLTRSIILIGEVFVEKRAELGMTLFVAFVLLLVSSTLMWYIESDVQPDNFANIVTSFWWAVATLTTVGYGDIYPVTAWGKFLSGIIAVLGIGIVALPAGILSSAFIGKLDEAREEREAARDEETETEQNQAPMQTEDLTAASPMQHGSACTDLFGQPFVYCPYCGEKLQGTQHKHGN